jgi:hypothetical protein
MTSDRTLDQALRAAAESVDRGRAHRPAAQDLLNRVVATPRVAPPVSRPARNRRGRWALAGVAAAAVVTAASLVLPGPGGDRQAYASWTATPAALSPDDTAALARECVRGHLTGYGYRLDDLDRARKILGERRGAYGYVAVATPAWTAGCFRDEAGAVHAGSMMEAPVTDAQLGRTGVEMQGWSQLRTGEGFARLMSGHLGRDVVGVDIAIPGGRTVRATVEDRYFVAWYPEAGDEQRPTTLTLRLRDGRTVGGLSARDLHDAPKLD